MAIASADTAPPDAMAAGDDTSVIPRLRAGPEIQSPVRCPARPRETPRGPFAAIYSEAGPASGAGSEALGCGPS
ncbi:hypothetical protein JCM16408A_03090 [Methylobacterium phyllosphaerae]